MHSSSVDLIIFTGFFTLYLFANFFCSTKPTSIDDYTNPKHNFSTSQITSTFTSLWIGSGLIFYIFVESYKHGLYFIIPSLFMPVSFLLVGYFICPRVNEFLGRSSIAEITKELWGDWVALFTAISYILISLGIITAKIKFTTGLLTIFFDISHNFLTIICAAIIITYSLVARIKIAVFSDVIQFATFCCILPIALLIAWKGLSNTEVVWHVLNSNPKFNLKHVLDTHNPNFFHMLGLCIFAFIPKFGPMAFANIVMPKNVPQLSQAFKASGIIFFILQVVTIFLATVIASSHPNINPDNLFNYCINHYSSVGLKGTICLCILILTLCITDFLFITSSSMFARHILKPFGFKWAKNESSIFKYFTIIACIIATYLTFKTTNSFTLVVDLGSLMIILVSIPILLAIFGFRSSELSVVTGMIGSIIVIVVYQWKFTIQGISFLIPGILANIIFLFGSHYLLKQPGGWLGIKGKREFEEFKQEKRRRRQQFLHDTFDIDFLSFCKQGLPNSTLNISFFGIFALVSIFLTQISLPNVIAFKYTAILDLIYPSAFIIAINLVFYPIWHQILKKEGFLSIVWLLSVLYISIITPTIFAFISNFLPMQMIIALINLIAIFVMLKWNISVFLLVTGGLCASLYLYCFAEYTNMKNLQLQISYLLLFLSGALITFLKPYRDEKKNLELFSAITKQIRELSEQTLNLLIVKKDIMNNFKQDIQSPIENLGAGAVTLNQNKNTLEKPNRDSAELIYREYRNLQRDINKLVDLSKFNTGNVALNYQDINFEELVENAISLCKSSDFKNPDLNFKVNTQAIHLIITCDRDKIFQCLEYLIKNAINFTKKGTIEVLLENQDTVINESMTSTIKCSIIDEGIGIPENELQYVFGTFAKSSYTKNTSKGLGLALCQRIIELHHGTIWAENNKTKPGTTFTFIIPKRPIST